MEEPAQFRRGPLRQKSSTTSPRMGWIEESPAGLSLSPAGVEQHLALAPAVGAVRQQISAALPRADYEALISLLARLVAALEHSDR